MTTVTRFGTSKCVGGDFQAVVSGLFIRGVSFLLDGQSVGPPSSQAPFVLKIHSLGGVHTAKAQVTFTDGTPARSISFRFRTCAEPVLRAPSTPHTRRLPPFTG